MSESACTVAVVSILLIVALLLGETANAGSEMRGERVTDTIFVGIATRCDVQMRRGILYLCSSQVAVKEGN